MGGQHGINVRAVQSNDPVQTTICVSGSIIPDQTGNYKLAGTYNDKPFYKGITATYAIWWRSSDNWQLSAAPGLTTGPHWRNNHPDIEGDYLPYFPATGTAHARYRKC